MANPLETGVTLTRRTFLILPVGMAIGACLWTAPAILRDAHLIGTELEEDRYKYWYYWQLLPDSSQPPETFNILQPSWLEFDKATNQFIVNGDLSETNRFVNHLQTTDFIPDLSPTNPAQLASWQEVNQSVQSLSLADNLTALTTLNSQTGPLFSQHLARTDVGSPGWHDSLQEVIRSVSLNLNYEEAMTSHPGLQGDLSWAHFNRSGGFLRYLKQLPKSVSENRVTSQLVANAKNDLRLDLFNYAGLLVEKPELLIERLEAFTAFEAELVQQSMLGMITPDYMVAMEKARQSLITQAGRDEAQENQRIIEAFLGVDARDEETGEWQTPSWQEAIAASLEYGKRIQQAKSNAEATLTFADITEQIGKSQRQTIQAVLTGGYQAVYPGQEVPPVDKILDMVVEQIKADANHAFGEGIVNIDTQTIKRLILQQVDNLHSKYTKEGFLWNCPADLFPYEKVVEGLTQLIARYFEASREGLPYVDSSTFVANLIKYDPALAEAVDDPDSFTQEAAAHFQEHYGISFREFVDRQQAKVLAKAVLGLALEGTFLNARPGDLTFSIAGEEIEGDILSTSPSGFLNKRGIPFYYPDSQGKQRYLPFLPFGLTEIQLATQRPVIHLAVVSDADSGLLKLVAVKEAEWARFKSENPNWLKPDQLSFDRARFGQTQVDINSRTGELIGGWSREKTITIDFPEETTETGEISLVWVGNFQVEQEGEWNVVSGAVFQQETGGFILKTESGSGLGTDQTVSHVKLSPEGDQFKFEFIQVKPRTLKKDLETKFRAFDLSHGGIFSTASLIPLQDKLHTLLESYDPYMNLPLALVQGLAADLSTHSDRNIAYYVEPKACRFNPLGLQGEGIPDNQVGLYYVLADLTDPDDPVRVVLPLGETSHYLPVLVDSRSFEPRVVDQNIKKLDNLGNIVDTGENRQFISLTWSVQSGDEYLAANQQLGKELTGVKKWLFDQLTKVIEILPDELKRITSHHCGIIAVDKSRVALKKREGVDKAKRKRRWRVAAMVIGQIGLNILTQGAFKSWIELGIPWQFFESKWIMDLKREMNEIKEIQ